jgi:hypothetical protein
MAKVARTFAIDKKDIAYSGGGFSAGNRPKVTKQSRALSITSKEVTLTHKPTGVSVSGKITPGHYSRREMQRLVAHLHAQLLIELQHAVARKLRLPGR